MTAGDANTGVPNDQPPPPGSAPAPDNLNSARLPGPGDRPPATQNTADHLLTNLSIDQPYNPNNIPGNYDANAIKLAKSAGFNADEVHALEEGGADRFNTTMANLQKNPASVSTLKGFADTMVHEQTNPNEIFNPMKIPGTYDPNAIKFAHDKGFSPDQIHVLEQFGPDNFNKTIAALNQNPTLIDGAKAFANAVGNMDTNPDILSDPKTIASRISPDAIKEAQAAGLNQNQMQVLGTFGADNFNNTMAYLKQHPDQAQNVGNLANVIGGYYLNMAPKKQ